MQQSDLALEVDSAGGSVCDVRSKSGRVPAATIDSVIDIRFIGVREFEFNRSRTLLPCSNPH